MGEHDDRFADSALSIQAPMTRRAALKLGAFGVLGAAVAYLPGRARAGGIQPAPCVSGQGFKCGGGFHACGTPGSGCGCAFQYTGSKITQVKSYCVDFNVCCSSLAACPGGQFQCPSGTICSSKTCCPEPVCMPACGANVPSPSGCLTPNGTYASACPCVSPQTCGGFFANCNGNANCFCFETAESGGSCGQNVFCDEVPGCSTSADCPSDSFCAVNTCCGVNICAPCCSNDTQPIARVPGARTASGR